MEAESLKFACGIYARNNRSAILDKVPDAIPAQMEKLKQLVQRYEAAPDEIQIGIVCEPQVIMTRWGNLWIGIETDGYAHS